MPVSKKRGSQIRVWDDEPIQQEKEGVQSVGKWDYFNSNGSDYNGIEKSVIGWTESELFN